MKKREVLALWQNLNKLGGLTGVKFAYAVAKNINNLKSEIEALEKSLEVTDAFKVYDNERIVLVEKYADRDENDKPKLVTSADGKTQEYSIVANKVVFDKKFEVLKKKNKAVLDAREKQIKDYNSMLDTDSDFVPHKIKLEDLPETINAQQTSGIFPIIEE